MNSSQTRGKIFCIFMAFISFGSSYKAAFAQTTIGDVKSKIIDTSKLLDSVYLKIKMRTITQAVGGQQEAEQEYEFALLDDLRYHRSAMAGAEKEEPDVISVYDGDFSYTVYSSQVIASKTRDLRFEQCLYCNEVLFLKTRSAEHSTSNSRFRVPECIDRTYVVKPPDAIEGTTCSVISNGIDTLWLDPQREYIPIRREIDPTGQSKSARFQYSFEDYRKVSGVWIPMSASRRENSRPGQVLPEDASFLEMIEWKVLDVRVNDLTPTFFDIELPDGHLFISDNGVFPIGGSNIKRISDLVEQKKENGIAVGRPRLLLIANLLLVTLIVLFWMYRNFAKRSERSR